MTSSHSKELKIYLKNFLAKIIHLVVLMMMKMISLVMVDLVILVDLEVLITWVIMVKDSRIIRINNKEEIHLEIWEEWICLIITNKCLQTLVDLVDKALDKDLGVLIKVLEVILVEEASLHSNQVVSQEDLDLVQLKLKHLLKTAKEWLKLRSQRMTSKVSRRLKSLKKSQMEMVENRNRRIWYRITTSSNNNNNNNMLLVMDKEPLRRVAAKQRIINNIGSDK